MGYLLVACVLLLSGPVLMLVTEDIRSEAQRAAMRLAGLEDSIATQALYLGAIQQLLTGDSDPAATTSSNGEVEFTTTDSTPLDVGPAVPSENWLDHLQPALPMESLPAEPSALDNVDPSRYLASLQLPVLPPVSGFVTRRFDAQSGHFAIDIATEEGSMVRCIGDGYVIFADWSYAGGHTIAVQHADGYVSVYKHNQRLLKRVADRVRAREGLAISGDSGEYTTGPHLHFELWNHGLAQDPAAFILGL